MLQQSLYSTVVSIPFFRKWQCSDLQWRPDQPVMLWQSLYFTLVCLYIFQAMQWSTVMTRLADDDVGFSVLSCQADILGTASQVILQQSLYSTFVYLYMFQGLAVQQSTLLPKWYYGKQWTVLLPLCICEFFQGLPMQQSAGYWPVGTTASNGLYS